jgi:hypothetical protein
LPARIFDRCVKTYHGDKWVKHFSCWRQMLCMMFGQLSGRDSLRDLLVSLTAHKPKYYHLGLGKNISRSTLADANQTRDYRLFESFSYEVIRLARDQAIPVTDLLSTVKGNVYACDSTTVDLCLSVFWWATFRKTKAAVKLHTLLDVRTSIPCFIHVSEGSVHDIHGMDQLHYEAGGYYVLDKGYGDFARLARIELMEAFFVTRCKDNLTFHIVKLKKIKKGRGVLFDQIIILKGKIPFSKYPKNLRRVGYYDKELQREFVFLTNNLTLDALEIAMLYKSRWEVELFFKWIKQHLQINAFWGTSMNAVKTQVYIAITTFALISLIKSQLKSTYSLYEILQILSVSLFDKTPLKYLLKSNNIYPKNEEHPQQLKIDLI